MPLDAAQQRMALQRIAVWRSNPKQPVACPACERAGLIVVDRSARPYAEWYALACAACGLDETLHVALGPSVPTLD
jgi:hypothetical protein